MAYSFAGSSSQYLSAAAPVTEVPLTIAGWCYPTSAAANQAFAYVGAASASNSTFIRLTVSGSTVYPAALSVDATAAAAASNGANLTMNAWNHVAAVFASATSRTAYSNGVAATANTFDRNTGTLNTLLIGSRYQPTLGIYYTGRAADIGVWNVALTDAEIASLSKGVSCRLIRPQSLVFYAPLVRDLVDERLGVTITNHATATVADHPRIYA